jgi:hypothetical protein
MSYVIFAIFLFILGTTIFVLSILSADPEILSVPARILIGILLFAMITVGSLIGAALLTDILIMRAYIRHFIVLHFLFFLFLFFISLIGVVMTLRERTIERYWKFWTQLHAGIHAGSANPIERSPPRSRLWHWLRHLIGRAR